MDKKKFRNMYIKSYCAMCGEPATYNGFKFWSCRYCGAISVYDFNNKLPILREDFYRRGGKYGTFRE